MLQYAMYLQVYASLQEFFIDSLELYLFNIDRIFFLMLRVCCGSFGSKLKSFWQG